jgi:hypothetical protein
MPKLDNKLNGARNLVFSSTASLEQTDKFKPKDSETLYRFSFDKSSSFGLSLSGLAKKTNADVEIYRFKNPATQVLSAIGNVDFKGIPSTTRDTNLQLLASAKRKGNRNENLAIANLDAGEYVVRVVGRSGKGRYRLQMGAVAIESPIIESPIKEEIDTKSPTAALNAANISTAGSNTYEFTVIYSDDRAINVASLDGNSEKSDIQVTGSNGFSQFATFVSVNDASNGDSRVATYRITAPGGTWDDTDNGNYTIALQGNQVSDTSGNFAGSVPLGSFLANIPLPRRVLQASGGSNGSIEGFSFTVNTKVKPQGNVFSQAFENFQFEFLRDRSLNRVASNINLGSANIVSSLFDSGSESGVEYTATFADYNGKLFDGSTFTLSSNRLVFRVVTSDFSSVNSLVPLESLLNSSYPYILLFADPRDANGNGLVEIPSSSGLTKSISTISP